MLGEAVGGRGGVRLGDDFGDAAEALAMRAAAITEFTAEASAGELLFPAGGPPISEIFCSPMRNSLRRPLIRKKLGGIRAISTFVSLFDAT